MTFHVQVPVLFCADANATRDATDARRAKENMVACEDTTRRNDLNERKERLVLLSKG